MLRTEERKETIGAARREQLRSVLDSKSNISKPQERQSSPETRQEPAESAASLQI
jgi:hypothetical protein